MPEDRGGALSYRVVLWGFAISLALGLAVGGVLYLRYLHFHRLAAAYIPEDARAALRVDVEQVILFEPVRAHLFPLLNRLPPPGRQGRLADLERATGISLAVDLRELLLAWQDDGAWVGVVAGPFPAGAAAGVVEVVSRDARVRLEPLALKGAELAYAGSGFVLAEPRAGVLLFGREPAVRAALAAKGSLLPREGPGAFSVAGPGWQALLAVAKRHGWVDERGLAALAGVEGLSGRVAIGSEVVLTLTLRAIPSGELPGPALQAALQALADAHGDLSKGRAAVRFLEAGQGRAVFEVRWPREAMLRFAELAGAGLLVWAQQ